jgi:5-methylcytosine-specific restriction endonuclease McrA
MKIVTLVEARNTLSKRYFTGVPCKRGHISERRTSTRACIACSSFHREQNGDQHRFASRRWAANNKERGKANGIRWRAENRDLVKQIRRNWYALNSAKCVAATLEWAKKNPEKRSATERRRKARKRAAGGNHTADDVVELYRLQRGKCAHAWCNVSLKPGYHVDHVQPLKRGGSNDRSNIQLLCPSCNVRKSASDPIEWAQRHGLLL